VVEGDSGSLASVLLEVIAMLIFVFVLICNLAGIYFYRTPAINVIYSFIFLFGSICALISPIFWFQVPRNASVCTSRLWFTSLGLSIVLGTMFSRTWQLNVIYQYRKSMTAMKKNLNQRAALTQLTLVLCTILAINLLILILWQSIDPYTNVEYLSDSLELIGEWKCSSNHMAAWIILEAVFTMAILVWGLFVIYKTWSFKQAMLSETRWVFLALYNVVLNLAAVGPIVSQTTLNDNSLALAMVVSIDFCVGGIASAVLLPRLFKKGMEKSSSSRGSVSTRVTKSKKKIKGPLSPGSTEDMEVELGYPDQAQHAMELRPTITSQKQSTTAEQKNQNVDVTVENGNCIVVPNVGSLFLTCVGTGAS